ncbi:hypothetical protein V495_05898 [Pseudogymnoascus sp. VKM F-4514 (FW-929)]|nr:hypothetical protein V495_05898 [Pseudogymnoascus sp. VKM F-4514 (FW-929)]KFY56088.1 hypothetical protein V497_06537 [Pseudogymnoascus sp. VKM F-4516 (FW-969)]
MVDSVGVAGMASPSIPESWQSSYLFSVDEVIVPSVPLNQAFSAPPSPGPESHPHPHQRSFVRPILVQVITKVLSTMQSMANPKANPT